jgi:hypothetical protein
MKFKKIVGFGDSWMYGDELLDPVLSATEKDAHPCWVQNVPYRESRCFLGLLGQHYGVPTENFGIPGGSLQSTIWTYLWWLDHEPNPEQCMVLIALTEADRTSFYNPNHRHYSNDPPWNKFVHSTWIHFGSSVIGPEFTDMIKRYLVLTDSRELSALNYQQAVLLFDSMSYKRQIPTIQFHIMPPPVTIPLNTIPDPDFSWTMHFRDRPDNQKRELIMPGGHPNELGHQIVQDRLISQIDSCIMYEC